jgi:hypothetical protein
MTDKLRELINQNKWRDISEAPRDGSEILCFVQHHENSFSIHSRHWDSPYWRSMTCTNSSEHYTHYRPLPDDKLAEVCKELLGFVSQLSQNYKTDEMDEEMLEQADFKDGYDYIIKDARNTIKRAEEIAGETK